MKKVFLVFCAIPIFLLAQETTIYGGRGMFKLQYAEPFNMGVLTFHIAPQERYETMTSTQGGQNVTDRKHFFHVSTGITYSIIDYIDARVDFTPFCKWFEMNNYPIDRGDPDPVIGLKSIRIGAKGGYPFIIDKITPLKYAFGLDIYVDIGPGLSEEWFSNALYRDEQFYADSFVGDAGATPVIPNFHPHIQHKPDIGITGLVDFRIGPIAAHLNGGYLFTGVDTRPFYVDSAEFDDHYMRADYLQHGFGVQLIPHEDARILFETFGMFDMDAKKESLWVTPGVRFGSKNVSFDIGCELGIVSPTVDDMWWKIFFNLSGGTDLVKKEKIHIPIAKVSGKVYHAKTNEPVNATISFPGSEKEAIQTGDVGFYETSFSPGSYRVHVEAPGYRWKEQGMVLKDGDQIVLDFALNTKPVSKIIGKIYDVETKKPIVAEITFPQTEVKAITSDTSGMYNITLAPATYRLHVEATNYQFNEKVVTLQEDESKVIDIALTKIGVDQAILTGKISEFETGKPLLAQLLFIDTNIPKVTTDPSTGIYKVTMPPGTYSVKIEAVDYVPESAPIVLAKDETKIHNFTLKPIPKVGEKVVLKGIYFDFNSAVIKPTSYPVLDDAAKVFKVKPKMRVEISGHTDSVGSDSYNQKLSYQRANSVRDYLIRYHNTDPTRLIAVGYGESQPVADNRTKSGRDMNRRIEFKILSW